MQAATQVTLGSNALTTYMCILHFYDSSEDVCPAVVSRLVVAQGVKQRGTDVRHSAPSEVLQMCWDWITRWWYSSTKKQLNYTCACMDFIDCKSIIESSCSRKTKLVGVCGGC